MSARRSRRNAPAPVIPLDPVVAAQLKAARLIELGAREALTVKEAAELGYGNVRTIREMMSKGVLKRCVLRVGKRGVRLLRTVMIEELKKNK